MKKKDEMETHINLSAIKWSWFFSAIALFAWAVYDFVRTETIPLAFFLLIMQFIIYFFVVIVSKSKAPDVNGSKSIWYVTCIIILLQVFGGILYFIHK